MYRVLGSTFRETHKLEALSITIIIAIFIVTIILYYGYTSITITVTSVSHLGCCSSHGPAPQRSSGSHVDPRAASSRRGGKKARGSRWSP